MPPPPPVMPVRLQPTAVWLLMIIFAVANLIQPACIKEYREFVKGFDSQDAGPSYDVPTTADERAPLYMEQLSVPNATSRNVDIGLQAQIENGFPLEPVSNVLPKKLILVYGLESSGTTFTAKTIAEALGIPKDVQRNDRIATKNGQVQVHHISLPWGMVPRNAYGFETQYSKPLPTVPVFFPINCTVKPMPGKTPPAFRPSPEACKDFMGDRVMSSPHRFFVNMTSNIQWYRERGVRVYPVMVIRDPVLHFQGILDRRRGHCPNAVAAYQQYEQGRAIMIETIEKGTNPLIVSYESMLTLQRPYLKEIYRQLGIKSNLNPGFRNGNTKYVSKKGLAPHVELELMKEDAATPKNTFPSEHKELIRNQYDLRLERKGVTNRTPPRTSQQTGKHARPNLHDSTTKIQNIENWDMHKWSPRKNQDGGASEGSLERIQSTQAWRSQLQRQRNAKAEERGLSKW